MQKTNNLNPFQNFKADIPASIVVALVAMPLCLGIAMASGAPLFAGIISGIVGGIIVGTLSGSSLGVSGPAAGLAVIVLTAITDLGSFNVFLVSVVLAGVIQLIMGFARAGIIGYYFPSSVIHGMLAGIGIIISLKQIPHAFGYDADVEGDLGFVQKDGYNTFTELIHMLDNISLGATIITAISLIILILWDSSFMKKFTFTKILPGPLVAVITGILLNSIFSGIDNFSISKDHLVSIPVPENLDQFLGNFSFPDFTALNNPKVYITAVIIAIVASLETLLSLEATDKLDTLKRVSPANRELKAQGIGNIIAGLIGGIPVTQVIVRSSANVQTGGKTKASSVMHGFWLLLSIILIPGILNQIPLATLAAILLVVGYKLAKPQLFLKMYKQGWGQFVPFMVTIVAMLFTDLLRGIGLGMAVGIFIILYNNLKLPFKIMRSKLKSNNAVKMVLAEDVTFLNKAAIQNSLASIPNNSKVTIDASQTHFMHYDILEIIENFEINAPNFGITVQKIGFDDINKKDTPKHFELELEPATTEVDQQKLTPTQALHLLKEGNKRFIQNKKLHRDYHAQIGQTSTGQFPFAAILSCIDSRVPVELVFDQGFGDLFSVRVAGNIVNEDVLGSMEYACKVAGSKIIVVMGHTSCGAVHAACQDVQLGNITPLLSKIKPSVDIISAKFKVLDGEACNAVSDENVKQSILEIRKKSPILAEMEKNKEIEIKGASYSVSSGKVTFFDC